jgi:hypothetical protein
MFRFFKWLFIAGWVGTLLSPSTWEPDIPDVDQRPGWAIAADGALKTTAHALW